MAVKKQSLGSLLVQYGFISGHDLEDTLKLQKETGGRLGEILIEQGKVKQQDIEWLLSQQLDIPFIIVDEKSIDHDFVRTFPRTLLIDNHILPMFEDADNIAVVTDDPFNKDAFTQIEESRGKTVTLSAGSGETIERILERIFDMEGAPELVSQLDTIVARLRHTSFYRLDFVRGPMGLVINAFGFGILRNLFNTDTAYSVEDIRKALNFLNLRYLYSECRASLTSPDFMMSVYPVESVIESSTYPVVLGTFGLGQPQQNPMLTELKVEALDGIYTSSSPVPGYTYFYPSRYDGAIHNAVFTIDSAPAEFVNHYVKLSLPRTCHECHAGGCDACNYLGYVFRDVEGVYSLSDINNFLKEV